MNELKTIPAGMPLHRGDAVTIRDGLAYVSADGETPNAVCTVDCTTNAVDVLEPYKD